MSDILLDNPPANGTDHSANDVFKGVQSFDVDPSTQPQKKVVATPPVEEKPQVDNAALESASKKKSPLDKLGTIKKPEEAKAPEIKAEPTKNGKEDNWKFLREKAEKAEQELNTLKPEYEKLKPEYETTKAELVKLKAMGLNEQERKEFQQYRQLNAVEAVKKSTPFQQNIMTPIHQQVGRIEAISANITAKAENPKLILDLKDACDIPNEFEREEAFRSILEQGMTKEFEENPEKAQRRFDSFLRGAMAAADKLQTELYPKMDKALAEAEDVQLAAENRQKQEGAQTTQREQEEMKKAHEHVFNALSTETFKPLLEDPDLVIDGVTMADAMKGATAADNPTDRALEIQSLASIPFVIAYGNKWRAKFHELEKATKLRNKSAPSREDGQTKPQGDGEKRADPVEVFQGRGKNFFGAV